MQYSNYIIRWPIRWYKKIIKMSPQDSLPFLSFMRASLSRRYKRLIYFQANCVCCFKMEHSLRYFEVIHIIIYSRYPLTLKKSTHWNTCISTIETQNYSMAEKRRKKREKSFRVWTPNSRTETKFEIFTANDTQPPRTVVSWSHNALLAGHTRTLEIGKHRLDTVFEKKKKL